MDKVEKFDLITKNLKEVLGEEELKKKLDSDEEISIYWGTMPTGSISIAYFFPLLKIADFLRAGCEVKILIADLHAALDSVPWKMLEKRTKYYEEAVKSILQTTNIDLKKLKFVKGSEFQLSEKYYQDLLKLSTITNINDAKRASSEGVKSAIGTNAKLSGLIYPLMQALDEEYLDVDAQFSGLDQRKIMVYAREYLPKINYDQRIELMTPMIRGLVGEKMSSSQENTKIDLLEDPKKLESKINKAEFIEGNTNNGIMAMFQYIIFNIKESQKEKLTIERPEKFGGNLTYSSYEELEKDVKNKKIHPLDIKKTLSKELNILLDKKIRSSSKLKKLHEEAYPERY